MVWKCTTRVENLAPCLDKHVTLSAAQTLPGPHVSQQHVKALWRAVKKMKC